MDIVRTYSSKQPAGYRQLQLTEALEIVTPPSGTSRVIIQPTGQDVRLRDDGVEPTASIGLLIKKDTTFDLLSMAARFKFISTAYANGNQANAVLDSTGANADITLTADNVGSAYNGYTFTVSQDATDGANATATLNIAAANGDLTFTSPTKSASHNGKIFEANSDASENVTYDANATKFTLGYIATTSNATTMKTAFDNAVANNPTWPQFTVAIEGDGSGTWVANDDGANATSANGVDPIAAFVEFNTNTDTFTIHIVPNDTAAETATLIDAAMTANPTWPQFEAAEEGAGAGVVDNNVNDVTAGGVNNVGALLNLNFYKDLEF